MKVFGQILENLVPFNIFLAKSRNLSPAKYARPIFAKFSSAKISVNIKVVL